MDMKRNMLILIGVVTGLVMQTTVGSKASKNAELTRYIQSLEQSILAKDQRSVDKDKYKRPIDRAMQLIKQGADVNTSGPEGITLLMFAVLLNRENLVKRLLATPGINVNLQGTEGESALLIAVHRGYSNIVKLLLAAGADTTLKTYDGETALDLLNDPNYSYEKPPTNHPFISVYKELLDARAREELENLQKDFPTLGVEAISDRKVKAKQAILEMLQKAQTAKKK